MSRRAIRLTSKHLEIISALGGYFVRETQRWSRELPGNYRSVRLLSRLGLIEARVLTGPRGGRIVERRLTIAGDVLRSSIVDDCELGRDSTYTYYLPEAK